MLPILGYFILVFIGIIRSVNGNDIFLETSLRLKAVCCINWIIT